MKYFKQKFILFGCILSLSSTISIADESKLLILKKPKEFFTELPCKSFSKQSIGCNKCYDGGHVYKGKAKEIFQSWSNSSDSDDIFYKDENTKDIKYESLNGTWFTSNNLTKYTDDFIWYTGNKTKRQYHSFPSGTKNKLFLITRKKGGIKFIEPDSESNRNIPAYKIIITANYRKYKDILSKKDKLHTIHSCTFYKPAWCGDGEVDKGEECDPKAKGYSKNTCDVNTCVTK